MKVEQKCITIKLENLDHITQESDLYVGLNGTGPMVGVDIDSMRKTFEIYPTARYTGTEVKVVKNDGTMMRPYVELTGIALEL